MKRKRKSGSLGIFGLNIIVPMGENFVVVEEFCFDARRIPR
jgi:hypothetical protein